MDSDYIEKGLYNLIKRILPISCVDLLVVSKESILVCKRNNSPDRNKWGLPGGRIIYKETLEDAVYRKAREELGIRVLIKGQLHTYSVIVGAFHAIGIVYEVVPLDKEIKLDSQHSKFKWIESPCSNMAPYAKWVIERYLGGY